MNIKVIKEFAKTEGFYGQVVGRLDFENYWAEMQSTLDEVGVNDEEDLREFFEVNEFFRNKPLTEINQNVLTCYSWFKSKKGFSEFATPYSQVSYRLGSYFLEVLPPIYCGTLGFLVGEPYGYDPKANEDTHAAFATIGQKPVFLGIIAKSKFYEHLEAAKLKIK